MERKLTTLLVIICAIVFTAYINDDDPLSTILAKLEQYKSDYPQEKVHLHFDKSTYSLGDDIWFKAYIVNSEKNELSALSNVLFVDIIDANDSVRQTLTLPIVNGLTHGDVKLSDSLYDAGTYNIRAYTRWMQNFDPLFMFHKSVTIGDALSPSTVIAQPLFTYVDNNDGSVINGDIVFKDLGNGSPMANTVITYTVTNNNGKAVASGKQQTDALGKLALQIPVKKEFKGQRLKLTTSAAVSPSVSIRRIFAVNATPAKTDLQFFPEGGHLVNGLQSRVGFKAVDPDGSGAQIEGYITDEANNRITSFKSEHGGMGSFLFKPILGKKYTAVVKTGGGQNTYPFPSAEASGVVMSVTESNGGFNVSVSSSPSLMSNKDFTVLAQQNGVVKVVNKLKINVANVTTKIDQNQLGSGIVHLTLFNAAAAPVAERLVFVLHNDQLKTTITTAKTEYRKREKVETQIKVTSFDGQPAQGSFSVSVTNANQVPQDEDAEATIFSDLLLTSDLKGYVENPGYYFNAHNADRERHLDNLLLTQGWSRFTWKDIAAERKLEIKFEAQHNLSITGKVFTLTDKPAANAKLTLFAQTDQGLLLMDTVADENGDFVFDSLEFSGNTQFIVRAKNSKQKDNVKILLNRPLRPAVESTHAPQDVLAPEAVIGYLKNAQKRFNELSKYGLLNKTIMLKAVKINESKVVNKYNKRIAGSAMLGNGTPDIVITKEKLKNYTNMIDAFYGLPGIEVRGTSESDLKVYQVGRVISIMRSKGEPMMILLNGQVVDYGVINKIPAADVEGIEISKSGSQSVIYGDEAYWGVINVTLKRGGSDVIIPKNDFLSKLKMSGYALQRQFYSPAYDKPVQDQKVADLRSSIFWEPDVITDEQGKATFSYFTGDEPGVYRVTLEGMNLDGQITRQVHTFVVR